MTTGGAPDFETALEECCTRVRRGEPLQVCLEDCPAAYREELARLVPLATRLEILRRDPSPAFEARLQRFLLTEAASRRGARFRAWKWPLPVLKLASTAMAVVLVLGATGMGVSQAAEGSLPDSPLYNVKTAREWVERAVAPDEAAREAVHTRQVAERGRELERAQQQGKGQRVFEELARRVVRSTERIVGPALEAAVAGNLRPARRAQAQLKTVRERVETLAREAPPAQQPAFQRLVTYLDQQQQRLQAAGQLGHGAERF